MRHSVWAVLLCGLVACGPPQTPPKPPTPPQVFLVAPSSNVVGTSFKVKVNVTGCTKVEQLQLQQESVVFKTANFKGANTEIQIDPGDIARFYGTVGIAANLTIAAKAVCDDGRSNTSSPVGIQFFPVASVVEPGADMGIVLPDSFVAEGGIAGAPVTFVGCANTSSGLALVRVDTAGQVVGINATPPLPCDYYATITEKVAGGLRWLFEPGKGAFAFNQNLNITGGVVGDFAVFAAGPDGDAIVWDSQSGTNPSISKISRNNAGSNTALWVSDTPGIVNGQPAFDPSTGLMLVPSWRIQFGSQDGTQTIQYVNYAAGGAPTGQLALVTQRFEMFDVMNPPHVAFSPDARTIYIAVPVQGSTTASAVIACGTQGGGGGCTQRWRSPNLPSIVQYILPFANGTKIAAIAAQQVWFLEESSMPTAGQVLNPNGMSTAVSGQLYVSGAQGGLGSDFYLLAGTPFATEIIAFDNPANGEVFRYSLESGGASAQSAITMAVDDSGQPWLRIGVNQVRPLSLSEYRVARGSN